MGRAETNALVGDREGAIETYKKAAQVNPVKAKPWIKMSQLYFAGDDYGHAIIAANEGLKRKPSSWRVDSILAISGLRVAFDALGRLRSKVGVSGSVREEARRLVQLLRGMVGEQQLVKGGDDAEDASIQSAAEQAMSAHMPEFERAPEPAPQVSPEPSPEPVQKAVDAATDAVSEDQGAAAPNTSGNPFSVLKQLSGN